LSHEQTIASFTPYRRSLADAELGEDAVDDLDSAYLKLYNAYNDLADLQRDYFGSTDQESLRVKESKAILSDAVEDSENYISEAKENYNYEKIDLALFKVKPILSSVRDALKVARDMTETISYRNTVSSADKTDSNNSYNQNYKSKQYKYCSSIS